MRGEMGEDGRGVVMEIVYSEWLIIFEHLEHLERARALCVCVIWPKCRALRVQDRVAGRANPTGILTLTHATVSFSSIYTHTCYTYVDTSVGSLGSWVDS